MADVVREAVPITAYDAPDERTLRVFFLHPWTFITDVELSEPDDGTIRVALHRRVLRATPEDPIHEVDAAFLVVDSLRFDLEAPIGERRVQDAVTGNPIATVAGAAKRGLIRAKLIEAPTNETHRWRFG